MKIVPKGKLKPLSLAPIKRKKLDTSDFVLAGAPERRGSKYNSFYSADKMYIIFLDSRPTKNDKTYFVDIKIGKDILDEIGVDVEEVKLLLYHHPQKKKTMVLIFSENGKKCNMYREKYVTFRQTWYETNAWHVPKEDRKIPKEVEFELFENAIMFKVP
jgi:hypothetical protein